jgi:uncharacterized protein YggT (Ycf19 family)
VKNHIFVAYPDEASATVVEEYLRLNDCRALLIPPFPGPDFAPSAIVLVLDFIQVREVT